MYSPWACVSDCGREFPTQQGLEAHQAVCKKFALEDHVLAEHLAERKARRKRRRVEKAAIAVNELFDASESAQNPPLNPFPLESSSTMPSPPSTPAPLLGRGRREKRPTWKVLEQLPQLPTPVTNVDSSSMTWSSTATHSEDLLLQCSFVWKAIKSAMNLFGMYREYPDKPTYSPDDKLSLEDISYTSTSPSLQMESNSQTHAEPRFPFSSWSAFRLMNWMWTGSQLKSVGEVDRLVHEVLLSPDFCAHDLASFSAKKETAALDGLASNTSDTASPPLFSSQDGWTESTVRIDVPDGLPHRPDANPPDSPIPTFAIPGLFHRSLTEIIKAAWSDSHATQFHYTPFRHLWQRSPDHTERIYDEIYSSDAFIKAHEEVQKLPAEPGCTLERVVCALMLWSDSTHLANFGTAALWPLYLFFGNQSKYFRSRPNSGACHHAAYIPKLPDTFYDFYLKLTGQAPNDEVLTHCRRELMHAVYGVLLDNEFLEAWKHGIVIKCPDGITRRVYPRILTYSADYPEKVLLATIRNLGRCPCPRCKVEMAKVPEMGMERDDTRRVREERVDDNAFRHDAKTAHRAIYELGKGIKSAAVEAVLGAKSYVPTRNAFSEKLSGFGFNFFSMLVVDFMHEVEHGVWKALFTHLIRILMELPGKIVELNRRYRLVPTFGRATIRPFGNNASGMKKMAARNFEALLKCAIPVFENLLPEPYNKGLLDLLFTFALWHGLAKLRMHTDSTLGILRSTTKALGTELRRFVTYTCSQFETKELPREEAARHRRAAKKTSCHPGGAPSAVPATSTPPSVPTTSAPRRPENTPTSRASKRKLFNLNTYKLHALGDYVRQIMTFGTTDSYSTQRGEFEHRHVKRYYARTNKNHAVRQITRLEHRERVLHKLAQNPQYSQYSRRTHVTKGKLTVGFDEREPLPTTPPEVHHHISHSRNLPVPLSDWLSACHDDPLTKDFYNRLKDHLLERLLDPDMSVTGRRFSPEERGRVIIQNDRLYLHKVLRVNYTTYDVRRAQDSMNPRTHADIMTLSREQNAAHPFSYARVIGIFHVDVIYQNAGSRPLSKLMEVLWVRPFTFDHRWKGGFKARRLHRVYLPSPNDDFAYDFLDPDDVIRGTHLIPAFAHEPMEAAEYSKHYVNIFVDRDMLMRYLGMGVGHNYSTSLPEDESAPPADSTEDDDLEEPVNNNPVSVPVADHADNPDMAEKEDTHDSEDGDEDGDEDSDNMDDEDLDLGPEDGEDEDADEFNYEDV